MMFPMMEVFDIYPQRREQPSYYGYHHHPFYHYSQPHHHHNPFYSPGPRRPKRANSHFPNMYDNFWLAPEEQVEEPLYLCLRKRSRSADPNNKNNNNNSDNESNKIAFNVRGFKPEEVKISADKNKRTVTVAAEREEKSEGGAVRYRSMRQSFRVGDSVDLDKVAAKIEGDVLVLEAPKMDNMLEEEKQDKTQTETEKSVTAAAADTEQPADVDDGKVAETDTHADKQSDTKMDEQEAPNNDNKDDSRAKDAADKIEVPIIVHQQEPDRFKASVNVAGFPLSSLTVKVTDRDNIKVHGRVEEVDKEDGSVSTREFTKEVLVKPVGRYDLGNMVYKLSEGGKKLLLEAPRKKEKVEQETTVPINVV